MRRSNLEVFLLVVEVDMEEEEEENNLLKNEGILTVDISVMKSGNTYLRLDRRVCI